MGRGTVSWSLTKAVGVVVVERGGPELCAGPGEGLQSPRVTRSLPSLHQGSLWLSQLDDEAIPGDGKDGKDGSFLVDPLCLLIGTSSPTPFPLSWGETASSGAQGGP